MFDGRARCAERLPQSPMAEQHMILSGITKISLLSLLLLALPGILGISFVTVLSGVGRRRGGKMAGTLDRKPSSAAPAPGDDEARVYRRERSRFAAAASARCI